MNKNKIVLADSSYTIRRIVELSFAEEDIDLVSFESGLNLKEKLLELKPKIVLVDIKLPETNGYEICQYINETDALKSTKVFLMKGGFEPIDEDLLKDLEYVDIITKPFDSNALVNTLKGLLGEKAPEEKIKKIPSTLPEDLPGIEGFGESGEEISFSDIKEEIDSGKGMSIEEDKIEEEISREDVMPSEEKTQGSPPEKDSLKFDNIEEIENPFKDEKSLELEEEELEVKKNIQEQENELEIASLTQEEINIKKIMSNRQNLPEDSSGDTEEESESEDGDTSDRFEDSIKETSEDELEIKEEQFPADTGETAGNEQPDELDIDEIKDEIDIMEKQEIEEEKPELDLDMARTEPDEQEVKKQAKKIMEEQIRISEIDIQKEEILGKVEDPLTIAIKEILWEIVPPLAEKIIKDEIKKIKSEIDSSEE